MKLNKLPQLLALFSTVARCDHIDYLTVPTQNILISSTCPITKPFNDWLIDVVPLENKITAHFLIRRFSRNLSQRNLKISNSCADVIMAMLFISDIVISDFDTIEIFKQPKKKYQRLINDILKLLDYDILLKEDEINEMNYLLETE